MKCPRWLLAFSLCASCVLAQDFRATLTGIVTDPSGAAVPDATVKATNINMNESKEVKTTSIGNYTIPYLDPGTYNIDVTAPGFQRLQRGKIVLRVADKVNLPLQLTVGQTTESITITGVQSTIETASADRGLVFDPIKTQQYPLNGRQTYMLMSLTPGVMYTTETFGPGGNSGTRGWDTTNAYKINGARTGQNLFLLNGAPISDNGGTWQIAPNVEAVQEFKVMTNTYDASYGRFGGGVVNTTIKGGTNEWHGDVFDYFRNAVLDANRTENKQTTPNTKRPAHNQHQFGGVVGGALRKDKDFIFGSFEGWREVQPASVVSSVPAAGLVDGQHFSDYGYMIYDPMTTAPCAAPANCRGSAYIRQPFAGNVIPKSRISPVGQKVLSYFPAPNGPDPKALSSNFYTNTNGRYRYDQPMGRWDHNFGESDKIYALVTYQHGKEYRNSTGFAPPAGSGDINSQRTDQNYVTAWTHLLSPTTVLDVRGSYARYTSMFPRYTDYDLTVDKVGMTKMPQAPTVTKATLPRFDVNGSTQLFALSSSGEWSSYSQWNFTPSVMMTRGRHSLKTGFEYNYVQNAVGNKNWANGTFTFDRGWTRQLSGYDQGAFDGNSVASLLLGYPASGQIDWQDNPFRTRPYIAFYVQDDWKVSSNVTVNMGLRYDVQIPWKERFNRSNRGWDFSTKNPYSDAVLAAWRTVKAQEDAKNPKYPYPAVPTVLPGGFLFAGDKGQPSRLYDTDYSNLGPRVGVAWQVRPNSTVIRAGGGVYYMSPTQNDTTTGFAQTTNYQTSTDGMTPNAGTNLSGPYSLVDPYPGGILAPTGASLGLTTNVGRGVSYDPARFKIPRTYQYSFGIQQQLPAKMMAEVSYAGNYQTYINMGTALNEISMSDFNASRADTSYNSTQVPNPFYGILPQNGGQGQNPTISRGSLLRPNPIFQGITNNLTQWGRYRFDSMQVKLEKRYLGGASTGVFTWGLSYTFSKAFEANHRLQTWNLSEPVIKELDNTDKPHMLSFHGVWDLPIGKGRKYLAPSNPAANALASGWQIDWIYTYNSGYPTSWPDLVNLCGDWHASNQNRSAWFNNDKKCYQNRQSYTLRVVPDRFSDIRNPSTKQLNIAVEKTTRIHERYRFLIRAEAFNITNTADYAGPDTSFSSDRFGMLPNNQRNWPRLVQISAKVLF